MYLRNRSAWLEGADYDLAEINRTLVRVSQISNYLVNCTCHNALLEPIFQTELTELLEKHSPPSNASKNEEIRELIRFMNAAFSLIFNDVKARVDSNDTSFREMINGLLPEPIEDGDRLREYIDRNLTKGFANMDTSRKLMQDNRGLLPNIIENILYKIIDLPKSADNIAKNDPIRALLGLDNEDIDNFLRKLAVGPNGAIRAGINSNRRFRVIIKEGKVKLQLDTDTQREIAQFAVDRNRFLQGVEDILEGLNFSFDVRRSIHARTHTMCPVRQVGEIIGAHPSEANDLTTFEGQILLAKHLAEMYIVRRDKRIEP